mgnify:CR=1 FL=1
MTSDFKIIGKYKQMKTFEIPEDFNKFYNKHKEEIDAKSTNQLNKELKIKGFKITKRNMRIVEGKKVSDLHLKQTNKDENRRGSKQFQKRLRD